MNQLNVNVRGMAHDLNNQIMILMNALDRMVVLCPHDADAMRAVEAAEHCALLTNKLLPDPRQLPDGSSVREIVSEAAMLMRTLLSCLQPPRSGLSRRLAGSPRRPLPSSKPC